MLVCDKCGAGITEGSKFCPQCGDAVTDADRITAPKKQSNVARVEILFGYSSSPNYQKAVNICKNIPTYETESEGKQATHKVSLPITEIELIINLFDLVGNWKSSQMLINGHSSTKKQLTYYGVGCFRSRQKAYKPEQYCFGEKEFEANIWGCKRLNMPIYEWGGGWLEYGKFDNSGIWHFDKKRIRHELEIAIKENELCPVLEPQKIFNTLEKIPDTINPKRDKKWAYRTSYEEVKGNYKEVAVGIKPLLNKVNFYVLGDYKPTWESESHDSEIENNVKSIELNTHEPTEKIVYAKHSSQETKSSSKGGLKILSVIVVLIILYFVFR